MKAARLHAYGERLVIDDVPTPRPDNGQVLVKVEGAGFCHSDIHVIDGEIRVLTRMPLTLGHENAGRVAAVGAGVQIIKEGDPVAVYGGCLENSAFEVQFEATLWGTIEELREVLALAESGRLSPIPLEFEPLDRINEVYARVKHGQVAGRAVIRP
jgi:D-arabinose 1-dehydrogenase-like Zn-dependent alcohol dehydrogenase